MALESTQPLMKMSTRDFLGGKGGRCVKLRTSPPSRAEFHEMWEHKPPGTLWTRPGLLRDFFTFYLSRLMKVDRSEHLTAISCSQIKMSQTWQLSKQPTSVASTEGETNQERVQDFPPYSEHFVCACRYRSSEM
jgi:hypothetical protein